MGFRNLIQPIFLCLFLSTSVFAVQITGTVTNSTTNKPAAGNEVVLLSLAAGMEETSRSKTDALGRFTLNVPDEGVQHLVRVAHQGVNYYRAAPPGTTSVEISVYDANREVPNILQESRMFRVQTNGGQLEVSESYTLRNESQPPRTKNGDQTFTVTVPEGAQVQDGMVAGPGGMPTTSMPLATGKGRYAFSYAIKPGRSQFQIVYKLSYNGSHEFTITPDAPLAQFGVLLPKSMKFDAAGGRFSPDSDESGMAVFLTRSLAAGQPVKFSVVGEGSAPSEPQGGTGGQASTPGGGLGVPIDAPDPLASSRGFIIGAFIVVLGGGAFWLLRRSGPKAQVSGGDSAAVVNASNAGDPQSLALPSSQPAPSYASLLDALKEELFQLESDRLHESISQQEYERQKAGLDALLRRYIRGTGQS